MDGATNMNVSNAPPAITAGEAKKLKKTIAKDAAAAEKHVSQVSKSLRSAEKDENKAEKVRTNIPSSLRGARTVYGNR
jgi:3-deoxy-D-arabino-heptulosonate 7-phosphate (DAHP) synthase class II